MSATTTSRSPRPETRRCVASAGALLHAVQRQDGQHTSILPRSSRVFLSESFYFSCSPKYIPRRLADSLPPLLPAPPPDALPYLCSAPSPMDGFLDMSVNNTPRTREPVLPAFPTALALHTQPSLPMHAACFRLRRPCPAPHFFLRPKSAPSPHRTLAAGLWIGASRMPAHPRPPRRQTPSFLDLPGLTTRSLARE
eukprot:1664246-Rhodomonas_salina.3